MVGAELTFKTRADFELPSEKECRAQDYPIEFINTHGSRTSSVNVELTNSSSEEGLFWIGVDKFTTFDVKIDAKSSVVIKPGFNARGNIIDQIGYFAVSPYNGRWGGTAKITYSLSVPAFQSADSRKKRPPSQKRA